MSLDINDQYDKIYRYCYLRVSDRTVAEDLTQDTFLRFLEHPEYKDSDKTLQLLYTIARNLCIEEHRRRKTAEIPEELTTGEDIEDSVLTNTALSQALDSLPDEDRELVLLRYINEVPLNDMAKLYNMSRFAMNRRLKKILSSLQTTLGKEELR